MSKSLPDSVFVPIAFTEPVPGLRPHGSATAARPARASGTAPSLSWDAPAAPAGLATTAGNPARPKAVRKSRIAPVAVAMGCLATAGAGWAMLHAQESRNAPALQALQSDLLAEPPAAGQAPEPAPLPDEAHPPLQAKSELKPAAEDAPAADAPPRQAPAQSPGEASMPKPAEPTLRLRTLSPELPQDTRPPATVAPKVEPVEKKIEPLLLPPAFTPTLVTPQPPASAASQVLPPKPPASEAERKAEGEPKETTVEEQVEGD